MVSFHILRKMISDELPFSIDQPVYYTLSSLLEEKNATLHTTILPVLTTYAFPADGVVPRLVALQCADAVLGVHALLARHALLRHDVERLRQDVLRRGKRELN